MKWLDYLTQKKVCQIVVSNILCFTESSHRSKYLSAGASVVHLWEEVNIYCFFHSSKYLSAGASVVHLWKNKYLLLSHSSKYLSAGVSVVHLWEEINIYYFSNSSKYLSALKLNCSIKSKIYI